MKKILFIFGTRPEAIKLIPLIKGFRNENKANVKICITSQHREMLDQVLDFFEITVDYDLDVMKPNQNLYSLTSIIILGLKDVFEDFNPDVVFVHGDTTTTLCASLSGFYAKKIICHIEAGLRTWDKYSPFPEEMNRQLTSKLSDLHFAPTLKSKQNLLKEGINDDKIIVTGNTVIDSLLICKEYLKEKTNKEIDGLKKIINCNKKLILITSHRRENFGDGFVDICKALQKIALEHFEDIQLIFPVHPNPNVQRPAFDLLGGIENIYLIKPLSYESFVWLMSNAYIVITDSGGVQEEAPSLGKPVIVLRETTERPEAVEAGTVILTGTNISLICNNINLLLSNNAYYDEMTKRINPYGDGFASKRIIDYIMKNEKNEFK